MKKGGILNPALCHLLASSGHTDYFTIPDRARRAESSRGGMGD